MREGKGNEMRDEIGPTARLKWLVRRETPRTLDKYFSRFYKGITHYYRGHGVPLARGYTYYLHDQVHDGTRRERWNLSTRD